MQFVDEEIFTVTEINGLVRALVEETWGEVAVLGEVSNFKRHSSGHLYFTLKDPDSQLRAVCFRTDARRLAIELDNGMKVVVRGRLTVYEGYGQYQIIARSVEEAGEGELERAFRELVNRLREEGLFDEARKKTVPEYPERIGVITSPTGAAIRDILSTLGRRWPCAEVWFVPVAVQGEGAATQIARAIDLLGSAPGLDVMLVGRGGGSLEDLWAFNEEPVARAIHRCPVPVISCVGHETDVTIADFVADLRAATPTMAAELAVPVVSDVLQEVSGRMAWLERYVRTRLQLHSTRLQELLRSYALGRVRGLIETAMQTLDYTLDRLQRCTTASIHERLTRLDRLDGALRALDPKAILSRGYTLCADPATGALVRSAADAVRSQRLDVTFHDGVVLTEVKEKHDER